MFLYVLNIPLAPLVQYWNAFLGQEILQWERYVHWHIVLFKKETIFLQL